MADKKGALLTRDQILQTDDMRTQDVPVPEWGGVVRVTGLTGAQRDAFESEVVVMNGRDMQRNTRNIRARLVAVTVVDAQGKRLFTHQDIEALGGKSAKALDRVFSAASALSGLSESDVEELAENFADGQSDDSISA